MLWGSSISMGRCYENLRICSKNWENDEIRKVCVFLGKMVLDERVLSLMIVYMIRIFFDGSNDI